MTHQRQIIRDAVISLLEGAAIVSGGRVYSNRNLAVDATNLPAITVYTLPEESVTFEDGVSKLQRTLQVNIELMASSKDAELTDDVIDGFADQIEGALKADQSWNGSVMESNLIGTDWVKDDRGGDASIGTLHMRYSALYFY